MDIIEALDNMKAGMPLIVTTKWRNKVYRRPTIYEGTDGEGIYYFIDLTARYKCTIRYIKEHMQIKTELETDEDIAEIVELNRIIKGGEQ